MTTYSDHLQDPQLQRTGLIKVQSQAQTTRYPAGPAVPLPLPLAIPLPPTLTGWPRVAAPGQRKRRMQEEERALWSLALGREGGREGVVTGTQLRAK